jgi:hypothetical protein
MNTYLRQNKLINSKEVTNKEGDYDMNQPLASPLAADEFFSPFSPSSLFLLFMADS